MNSKITHHCIAEKFSALKCKDKKVNNLGLFPKLLVRLFTILALISFHQKTLAQLAQINLSTYVRIGRYDLPEPTRTTPPANSLLAQEVSAVTYNWDTQTLFVVGDGGTSVVQVTKTGQLINSMTLAPGSSPQGTEFYDPEGLTYVGNGQFVMSEERDRQAVLFTYVAGTTLTRSAAKTVKLGTTVGNIGIEGISYDPLTSGYIAVKETQPLGIFQTGIDFNAGTATNGSPTTVNSVNLFDPALANLLDFADVFALSNLPALNGTPEYSRLLVLSQESGKIVNIDRAGNISSSLTIVSDPGNPLTVPNQQHEGLTMDRNGILYVVSENGGGDFDHPQLWVYAPSTGVNQPPTAVTLNNAVTSILENTNTASPIKVADILVTDDGIGTNKLTLSGADANFFEITGTALYIKAGTVLDYETKTSYNITINVDDTTVGTTPDATTTYSLAVIDVVNETPPASTLFISEVAPWSSGNSPVGADWFEVSNTGTSAVNITGWKFDDNSNSFASSVALNGITGIAPGESVIFLETATPATTIPLFISTWFGANPPAGLQVGSYTGSGVGLSTGGDAVNLYNSSGLLQASVIFGSSPSGPFSTFDNAAGLNNVTISQMSTVGVNGAFIAANDVNEIGSPGTISGTPATLPVTITSLKAAQKTNGIQLDWSAYTEQNIEKYEVEKSLTAVNFSSIGSVAAKGNGTLLTNYSYIDVNPFAGANYYRIKVLGNNGEVKLTNIVRVQLNTGKGGVEVYPNPVQGNRVTIELNNVDKGRYMLYLYNNMGQQIFSKQIDHQGGSATQSVQLSQALSAGVYQLRVVNKDKQFTQTIIAN